MRVSMAAAAELAGGGGDRGRFPGHGAELRVQVRLVAEDWPQVVRVLGFPQVEGTRNVSFGSSWNQGSGLKSASFAGWASGLPGIQIATTIETPYSQVGKTPVSPAAARILGRDLAEAIKTYLANECRRPSAIPSQETKR